eukprot:4118469-Prorocentrum_lima.AAC.1
MNQSSSSSAWHGQPQLHQQQQQHHQQQDAHQKLGQHISMPVKKKLPKEVDENVEKVTNSFAKTVRRYIKTTKTHQKAKEDVECML